MKNLCVYCGSQPGDDPVYVEAARELGVEMVRRGITLVYGGGSTGIMGAVADAVLDNGGHAIGVIPHNLFQRDVLHENLSDTRIVDSMHERKMTMYELADAFIALPGGLGTFEEILEIMTWYQIGIHKKSIGFLNINGYYQRLLDLFSESVRRSFIPGDTVQQLVVANTVKSYFQTVQST